MAETIKHGMRERLVWTGCGPRGWRGLLSLPVLPGGPSPVATELQWDGVGGKKAGQRRRGRLDDPPRLCEGNASERSPEAPVT